MQVIAGIICNDNLFFENMNIMTLLKPLVLCFYVKCFGVIFSCVFFYILLYFCFGVTFFREGHYCFALPLG